MSNFSSYADLLLEEIESKEEGSFLIKNLEGFAILTVYPGGREGKPIALEEVMNRIHLFGIIKIDIKKIEDIIHNADGNEHRIGEWSGGIPIDAKLDLEVSEDKMEAYVLIHPPKNGGRMIGISDVYTLLETNSIKFGMMDKAIEEMVQKSKYLIKILVAKGKPPISSTRGYIKIYFDSSNKPELLQDERGKIDYKNIHIIRSVKTGQLLAQKVPPHSGENGKDIYGNDILFEIADDGHWKIGENCELSSDETRLDRKSVV
jgi:uncharacterized protein (DUF342 family)